MQESEKWQGVNVLMTGIKKRHKDYIYSIIHKQFIAPPVNSPVPQRILYITAYCRVIYNTNTHFVVYRDILRPEIFNTNKIIHACMIRSGFFTQKFALAAAIGKNISVFLK